MKLISKQSIQIDLPQERFYIRSINFKTLMVAASMLLIMGVGVIMGLNINQDSSDSFVAITEFHDAEKFYAQRVNMKLGELKAMGIENHDFKEDLDQLDQVYLELKAEMEGLPAGNSEIIVQALIQNYKAKILLLERIQTRLTNSNESLNLTKLKSNEDLEI